MSRQPIFVVGAAYRKKEFRTSTAAFRDGENTYFRKISNSADAIGHVKSIAHNYDVITSLNRKSDVTLVQAQLSEDETFIDFPLVPGVTLETKVYEALDRQDHAEVKRILDRYVSFMKEFETDFIPGSETVFHSGKNKKDTLRQSIAMLDATFSNIIVSDDDTWTLIDYEWIFDFTVPSDYLVSRTLIMFCLAYDDSLRYTQDRIPQTEFGAFTLPTVFLDFCSKQSIRDAWNREPDFQEYVVGARPTFMPLEENRESRERVGAFEEADDFIRDLHAQFEQVIAERDIEREKNKDLDSRIHEIENSRTWKVGTGIGGALRKVIPTRKK